MFQTSRYINKRFILPGNASIINPRDLLGFLIKKLSVVYWFVIKLGVDKVGEAEGKPLKRLRNRR